MQKTICNRENGSRSKLWDRQCWITDSMLSLVHSRLEYLFQRDAAKFNNADTDPDSPLWALLRDVEYYIEELRVKNGLREPSVLNRDEKWPESLEAPAPAPAAGSEPQGRSE